MGSGCFVCLKFCSRLYITVTYESGDNASFESSALTTEAVFGELSPTNEPTVIPNEGFTHEGWTDGTTTSDKLDDFIIMANTTLTAVMSGEAPSVDETPSEDESPVSFKKGNVSGTLFDASGNPLEGYEVTIHSDPVTTTTNSAGVFSFGGVTYNSHTLYLKDSSGTLIEQYALNFVYGNTASASISGNDITIAYTDKMSAVHMNFQANSSLDGFTFLTGSFVVNPTTGDTRTWWRSFVEFLDGVFR